VARKIAETDEKIVTEVVNSLMLGVAMLAARHGHAPSLRRDPGAMQRLCDGLWARWAELLAARKALPKQKWMAHSDDDKLRVGEGKLWLVVHAIRCWRREDVRPAPGAWFWQRWVRLPEPDPDLLAARLASLEWSWSRCHVCGTTSEGHQKRCSLCKIVYCGAECQRADWKTHKAVCAGCCDRDEHVMHGAGAAEAAGATAAAAWPYACRRRCRRAK